MERSKKLHISDEDIEKYTQLLKKMNNEKPAEKSPALTRFDDRKQELAQRYSK